MNTSEIKGIISHLYPLNIYFNGVYSIDNINNAPNSYPLYIICNTAPRWTKGEHWIAIYIRNKEHCEFFDSYGRKPKIEFLRFLKSRCKKIICNRKKIQSEFTSNCGGYCIYYLFYKTRQYSMKDITKNLNDKKINQFINSLYSPNNEKFHSDVIYNSTSYNQICKKMYQNKLY